MKSDSSLRRLLPFAAYFNICFFWGTAGVANKLSSSMIHPFFAGSLRFLIASVLMALWVGFRHESLAVGLRDGKTLAVGSVLMYFLNTVLLLFASRRVDAGISTVMVSLIPITILLVDSLAARKLCVSWVGIGGIIGGFAGIAVVVVGSISGGNADPIGIALLLLADIVWSVGTVYLKYQSISASVQVQIFYQSAIPAILFFFCAVLTGNFDLGKLSWRPSHGIYGNCRFHCRFDLLSVSAAQVENLCCFHVCVHQSGGGNPLKRPAPVRGDYHG